MRRWFLSYNSQDLPLLRGLEAAIRRKDPDGQIFFAPKSLRAGGFWLPALAQEIAQATVFVLVVGDKGLGAWQVVEYYEALDRRVKAPDFPVILMLRDGATAPGLPFLRQLHWIVGDDLAAEHAVARLVEAAAGDAAPPGELWRHAAPYRGLAAMAEADSDFFFGRAAETAEIIQALAAEPGRMPVLVGNSGVGKSSLAHAGVLAALARQAWPEHAAITAPWPAVFQHSRRWCVLKLRPGGDPLKALVEPFLRTWQFEATDPRWSQRQSEWISALDQGGLTLRDLLDATERRYEELGQGRPPAFLLSIDQGEELYARADDRGRHRFSDIVAAGLGDPRLRAIMSLRADFFGALQNDQALYAVHRQINVPPLREAALREVVARPAALLGARFETEGLAADIARRAAEESARDAGALPLLSYLLDDMWTQMAARGDGVLRLPAQAVELGNVLAERADAFLAGRPQAEDALRRVLTLKLATVREDGEPTRRRALRSEFSDDEWRLVSELADHPHRLLVTATPDDREPYAEVAHEAIFRRWEQLREWLAAEREFLAWRSDLEAARRRWQATPEGMRHDALLMGVALAQAQGWLAQRSNDLPDGDRFFIEQSLMREGRERLLRLRLQRRVLTVTTAALVLVSAIAGFAGYQWFEAERQGNAAARQRALAEQRSTDEWRQRNEAERQRALAESERNRALSTQSRLLADMSAQEARKGDAATALLLALEALPDAKAGVARPLVAGPEMALDAALRGLHERAVFGPERFVIDDLLLSPDGTHFLPIPEQSVDKAAQLWNVATRRRVASLAVRHERFTAAFSADGRRIVTVSFPVGFSLMGTGPSEVTIWDAGTHQKLATLEGVPEATTGAAFSPDGRLLVTTSDRAADRVRLWDARSGAPVAFATGQAFDMIQRATFSADSRLLALPTVGALGREPASVTIWDIATGERLGTASDPADRRYFRSHTPDFSRAVSYSRITEVWDLRTRQPIAALAIEPALTSDLRLSPFEELQISPDGRRVVARLFDGSIRLWDATTGQRIAVLTLPEEESILPDVINFARNLRFAFSADGTRLVTLPLRGQARLWDADTGAPIAELAAADHATFTPDGRHLITRRGGERAAQVWDGVTGARRATLVGHDQALTTLRVSPSGTQVFTGARDGTARLWDLVPARSPVILPGHGDGFAWAASSPDGTRVLTFQFNYGVRSWDARTGAGRTAVSAPVPQRLYRFAASDDRSRIVTWTNDLDQPGAQVLDVATGDAVATLAGHALEILDASFSPDGRVVATLSAGKTIRLWDAATGQQRAVITPNRSVALIRFAPDGRHLITVEDRDWLEKASLWDVERGELIANIDGRAFAFGPDGARLAFQSEEQIMVVAAATGQPVQSLGPIKDNVRSIGWSVDGTRIVAAAGTAATIWDIGSGREIARLAGHWRRIEHAMVTPDGQRVVTAARDNTVRLWNAETGAMIAILGSTPINDSDYTPGFSLSRDGRRILVHSYLSGHAAQVFDVATGNPLAVLDGHSEFVAAAAFSPDGRSVVTASADRTARIWPIDPDMSLLIDAAKAAAPRCLEDDQRQKFFLDDQTPLWCFDLNKYPYGPIRYGLTVTTLSDALAKKLGLPKTQGAMVNSVINGLPAQAAGLGQGDILLAVDGNPVADSTDFVDAINKAPAGGSVRITVLRDGKRREIVMRPRF